MNFRSSCYYEARTPKMPVGLVELMEGLSKDVLKNNPTDVYSFCANHMKKLLEIRDGSEFRKTNIDQKIEIAQIKIRERAALRCKNYGRKIKNTNNTNYLREPPRGSDTNIEDYVQERVIEIHENDLKNNEEHEIIATVDKENPKLQTDSDNTTLIELTNKRLDKNENNPPYSAEFVNQVSKREHSPSDIIDNNSINISEEIVSKEITNLNDNSDNEENKAVVVSEVLTKTEDINIKDDNKKILQLEINVGNNQCENSENEYINQEEDNNTVNHGDLENLNRCKTEINKNGTEEMERLNHENLTDDFKNNSSLTPIPYENGDSKTETKSSGEKNNVEETDDKQFKSESSKMEYSETRNLINNHSMDLETAAITIQKVFRSFLFRNKTQSIEDVTNIDVNLLMGDKENKDDKEELNVKVKDRRTLGLNRMDTVLQTVNEEKSLSLSTDDSSTLSSAATIIQAHVRGFLVRNKLNNYKTTSSTSGIDSDAQSFTSLEGDNENRKNKTILNIHIVPEAGNFLSRDESILTSIELSLDGSPPSSTNLHPLGYDKSERRKLKREDAIQSISPPSNNSGKLSEDIDSIKEMIINNDKNDQQGVKTDTSADITDKIFFSTNVMNDENINTVIDNVKTDEEQLAKSDDTLNLKRLSTLVEMTSDELDVITPSTNIEDHTTESKSDIKLLHSGECHDIVLPTKVSRNNASIVREFQNVVVYFLLWNNS